MASQQPPEVAQLMRQLGSDEEHVDEILAELPIDEGKRRYFHAMTHNTAAPTILSAGSKINVFPSEAVARVDGRTLPGWNNEAFRKELEPFLPEGIELEFEEEGPALEAELDSPLYEAIQASIAQHYPDVTLVPTMLTGATDAKAVVKLGNGIKIYGFSPQYYEAEMEGLSLVHGHNERISIKSLVFGLRVLADVVWRFCG